MLSQFNKISEKLSRSILIRSAFYYDGNQCTPLATINGQAGRNWFAGKKARPIVVVARNSYKELIKTYPVSDKSDLKKIILSEFGKNVLYKIGSFDNNQQRVQIISWLPAVLEVATDSIILIPETWLFAASQTAGSCHKVTSADTELVIHIDRDGLVRSFFPQGLLQSESAIRSALGISPATELQSWQRDAFLQRQLDSLFALPVNVLVNWQSRSNSKPAFNIRQLLVTAAVAVTLYGVIGSGYLYALNSSRQSQLERLSSDVADKLAIQSAMDEEQRKLAALVEAKGNWNLTLQHWDLLALLINQGVVLANVKSELDVMSVTGETESTTELVSLLSAHSAVSNIEFTAPMRRGRNGEFFSLRLTIDTAVPYPSAGAVPAALPQPGDTK
ncbi:hypothetical protein E0Z06_09780 [Rheinheimera sp. D18]|uniref:hypothetical protein n=1 Tax=Rheinheimera sp. D18 TaxID=2545632 RepID=UPI001053C204|nr:hypothetical protein [Rheinheimera sp. D18]QBL09785.1 hypothetical protein E0Z06_09780 [Rheinheimera sp. D18]